MYYLACCKSSGIFKNISELIKSILLAHKVILLLVINAVFHNKTLLLSAAEYCKYYYVIGYPYHCLQLLKIILFY